MGLVWAHYNFKAAAAVEVSLIFKALAPREQIEFLALWPCRVTHDCSFYAHLSWGGIFHFYKAAFALLESALDFEE